MLALLAFGCATALTALTVDVAAGEAGRWEAPVHAWFLGHRLGPVTVLMETVAWLDSRMLLGRRALAWQIVRTRRTGAVRRYGGSAGLWVVPGEWSRWHADRGQGGVGHGKRNELSSPGADVSFRLCGGCTG